MIDVSRGLLGIYQNIDNYGNGLIIFSHGYSDNLQKKLSENIKFAHINEFD